MSNDPCCLFVDNFAYFSLFFWKPVFSKIYLNKFKLHHLYMYLYLCLWINLYNNDFLFSYVNLDHVANAFISLLEGGKSGEVMAVWVNSPPYYIPGTFHFLLSVSLHFQVCDLIPMQFLNWNMYLDTGIYLDTGTCI